MVLCGLWYLENFFLTTYKKTVKRLFENFCNLYCRQSHMENCIVSEANQMRSLSETQKSLAWGVQESFRAFSRSYKFSRACHQLHVFPRKFITLLSMLRRFHSRLLMVTGFSLSSDQIGLLHLLCLSDRLWDHKAISEPVQTNFMTHKQI